MSNEKTGEVQVTKSDGVRWRMYQLKSTMTEFEGIPYVHIDASNGKQSNQWRINTFRLSGFIPIEAAAKMVCAPEAYALAEEIVHYFQGGTERYWPPYVYQAQALLQRMQDTRLHVLQYAHEELPEE